MPTNQKRTSRAADGQIRTRPTTHRHDRRRRDGEAAQHPSKAEESLPQKRSGNTLNIGELKDMSIAKLTQIAKDLNVAGATGMRKQESDLPDPEGADGAKWVHLLGRVCSRCCPTALDS